MSLAKKIERLTPLLFALYLGTIVRIFASGTQNFPVNDGGLFYKLITDITNNNFLIPKYTSYNLIQIPFAYPPLAFYLSAVIVKLTSLSIFETLKLIPLLFSIGSVYLFYIFAKELVDNKTALLATIVFSLSPRAYEWQIMGGGITRSMGLFLTLASLFLILKHFKYKKQIFFNLTIVSLSLLILTHLEWLGFFAYTFLLILLFEKMSLKNLLIFLKTFIISVAITSPWWLLIILRHGAQPFFSFLRSGAGSNITTSLSLLLVPKITDELIFTLIIVLGLLGFFTYIKERKYFFPAWLIFPILFIPRSSPNFAVFPLCFMVSHFLGRKFLGRGPLLPKRIDFLFFIYLTIHLAVSNLYLKYIGAEYYNTLSSKERDSMVWVQENTPKNSKFLVLSNTADSSWGMDALSEWFPALSERQSINTPQGMEWLKKDKFIQTVKLYGDVKGCNNSDISCIEDRVNVYGENFDYLLLSKREIGRWDGAINAMATLADKLKKDVPDYTTIFENHEVMVFKNER